MNYFIVCSVFFYFITAQRARINFYCIYTVIAGKPQFYFCLHLSIFSATPKHPLTMYTDAIHFDLRSYMIHEWMIFLRKTTQTPQNALFHIFYLSFDDVMFYAEYTLEQFILAFWTDNSIFHHNVPADNWIVAYSVRWTVLECVASLSYRSRKNIPTKTGNYDEMNFLLFWDTHNECFLVQQTWVANKGETLKQVMQIIWREIRRILYQNEFWII